MKVQLSGPVLTEPLDDGSGLHVVRKEFIVRRGSSVLRVPQGVVTNFASIPFPFNLILDPAHDHVREAAVVHDYLVGEFGQSMGMVLFRDGTKRALTWKESAMFFSDIMKSDGSRKWRRKLFYHSVMRYKDAQRLLLRIRRII